MIGTDANPTLGARLRSDGTAEFLVWAPNARRMALVLHGDPQGAQPMQPVGQGYFEAQAAGLRAGTRYGFQLDGGPTVPDPASRSQPDGVEGWSELIDPEAFRWTDRSWKGHAREKLVMYELHVGTFSPEGTFDGARRRLEGLRDLGITALELMPIAQFSGERNWGYDGVFPFAVQSSYGGCSGLQRLVDACHALGLSVVVDVVYNHLGPEGNHLAQFGPYFTDRYRTPWGVAINLDGPSSDEVRRFFLESATWLVRTAHLDGLRVDAVHAIVDPTARPFLAELTGAVHGLGRRSGRPVHMIAESALNDPRVVWSEARGGLGFDAMWDDDFHHALHVALTGERSGYFADFGGVADLKIVLQQGFSLAGRFSEFRGRRHGRPAHGLSTSQFVVCAQNHDQVGNRPFGERLSRLVPFEAEKLAAGITLLGPFLPLLFMGSEVGERAPFLYFTDHQNPLLARAVRRGRRREFAAPARGREAADPQSVITFRRSRLTDPHKLTARQRTLRRLYRELLALRARYVASERLGASEVGTDPEDPRLLWIRRPRAPHRPASWAVFFFGEGVGWGHVPPVRSPLKLLVASGSPRWQGPGREPPTILRAGGPNAVSLPSWSFAFYGSSPRGMSG